MLLAMFGDEAEALLRTIRSRHTREAGLLAGEVDATRAERIRELVRIVQESGVAEVEIEDDGMRVSVRRTDERLAPLPAEPADPVEEDAAASAGTAARDNGLMTVESPMVGVFYRAAEPGAPAFVDLGDVVEQGQTLCLLEAMKLFNELKADSAGIVRAIHVENGQPVEFGQPLFELEPIAGPPTL